MMKYQGTLDGALNDSQWEMWLYGWPEEVIDNFGPCLIFDCNKPITSDDVNALPLNRQTVGEMFGRAYGEGLAYGEALAAGRVGKRPGGIGDCNHSFVSGTHVLMADGTTKTIEEIKVGDKVAATDPNTGKTDSRKVIDTIVTKDDKGFVEITVSPAGNANADGSVIATATHPFWSPSEAAWVDAGDLRPGVALRTESGQAALVTAVRHFVKQQITYDLTVEGVHTYYVLASETPVLVHNSNGCVNWASNSVKTWGHTFKTHGAGAKNTKALTDRARSTNTQQGQWLNNDAAAEFLKGLHVEGAGPRSVRIPDGLGQVIMPDGSIAQARAATIIPSPNGLYKTGFPIIGLN
ncbi:hypothetical protein GTY54_14115 [Streptomyces sp. SID625]|nr:hypothetical protein [Streptomyces sp. SID625]